MSEQQGIRVGVNAAIVRDQAILLVGFQDAPSGLHYNLPGGGVHAGETLYAALRREVRWGPLADLPHIPLLPYISEQLSAALHATGQADPFIEQIQLDVAQIGTIELWNKSSSLSSL